MASWSASPSSRRAWIEIGLAGVAVPDKASPSSRRAWIEILRVSVPRCSSLVALLAEGVDRNNEFKDVFNSLNSRPPRGGRG